MLSANVTAVLYMVSAVLFILALRGLSSPETSRQGNFYGMTGMGIAIVTTLLVAAPGGSGLLMIVGGLAIGGGIGAVTAKRVPMTAMPQLVAASVVWACVSWRTQRPHEVRGGLELLEGYFDIGESGG